MTSTVELSFIVITEDKLLPGTVPIDERYGTQRVFGGKEYHNMYITYGTHLDSER